MKIGVIREGKRPADSRVTLNPQQCADMIQDGQTIIVQTSTVRCYVDADYEELGVPVGVWI